MKTLHKLILGTNKELRAVRRLIEKLLRRFFGIIKPAKIWYHEVKE